MPSELLSRMRRLYKRVAKMRNEMDHMADALDAAHQLWSHVGNPDVSAWRYRDGNWYDEFGIRMSKDNWDVVRKVFEWKKQWSDLKAAFHRASQESTGENPGLGNALDELLRSSTTRGSAGSTSAED